MNTALVLGRVPALHGPLSSLGYEVRQVEDQVAFVAALDDAPGLVAVSAHNSASLARLARAKLGEVKVVVLVHRSELGSVDLSEADDFLLLPLEESEVNLRLERLHRSSPRLAPLRKLALAIANLHVRAATGDLQSVYQASSEAQALVGGLLRGEGVLAEAR